MNILPLPAFNDNYIWVILQKSKDLAWVVDPGDAEVVLDYLTQQNKKLVGILVTHHHPDHTGGVQQLKERFNCPVYGPSHLQPLITHPVEDSDSIHVFEHTFKAIETPAHTLDHICYFSDSGNIPILFSGDTLFRGGCGRLMEGTANQMLTAMNKLKELPQKTKVYCTHEYTLNNYKFALSLDPDNTRLLSVIEECKVLREQNTPTLPSTIDLELACNPFMRTDITALVEKAAKQLNEVRSNNPGDQFSQVRRAKDAY
ncbi:hydroxyacylglutathione hydrolase [Marinomonas algicola]|jgi:hydroxyacylglutathione hydrolase|uniref:hydroxyacylglutathione hydrolase n=1 Tax=Marinomonas algicola TaxID=2773454 RepID=UPI00174BB2C9|nr:hydroxyacylglutathione hydrolase [Marinomonas algicola]